jgi:hypothetical protein
VQISPRKLVVPIVTALAGLMVFVSPAFAQSGAPSAGTVSTASSITVIPLSPTTNRCVNPGHTIPCWAVTTNPGVGNHGCPSNSPVPFFLRSGGVSCIRDGELVEISCWFRDPDGSIQDHVIQENAGGRKDPGHIPDAFIDLGGRNPGDVGIPLC